MLPTAPCILDMAKQHQIFSSNKGTRTRAGRKWRRQAKQILASGKGPYHEPTKKKLRRKKAAAAREPLIPNRPLVTVGELWAT